MRQIAFCLEVPLAVTVEDVNAISGELLSSCTVGCAFSLLHLIIKLLAGAGSFLAVPTDDQREALHQSPTDELALVTGNREQLAKRSSGRWS